MNARNRIIWLLAFFASLLSACLDTSGTAAAPHNLGGTVVGLIGQLTLFANGTAVTLEQPGRFTFPQVFSEGTAYEVIVIDEPDDQECLVANGKGVMGSADVTNIGVTCGEKKGFRIGGKVNGLSGKLVLRNGTDTVTVMADGAFEFPVKVADGTPYAVGVEVEPVNQQCTIAGSVGAVMGVDVTNINVTCLVDDARLVDLVPSEGTLSPVFNADTTIYLASVSLLVPSVTLIPTASSPDAIILVNGKNVVSGMSSAPIDLAFGSNLVSVRVQAPSGAEREYAVIIDRQETLPTTYVKASNVGAGGDHFGFSVAVSGDLFVVGAPDEDSSAQGINGDGSLNDRTNSGAVYVYVRQGDTWKQEAYIKPSNTDYNDNFGSSVAIDGNTLVVGSPGEDSKTNSVGGVQNDEGSTNSGAAYVFVRDAMGVWSQQAYIKASNNDVNDAFGASVAISGDTIAIGAPAEDSNATGVGGDQGNNTKIDSGAVYVYFRMGTTWAQQAYVKSSNPDNGDKFGASIALYEDTLAVGSTDEDSNGTGINPPSSEVAFESGATYVFVRAAGAWSQQAFIKASNTGGDDRFGSAVALGKDRLVVGARTEDSASAGINANQGDNGAYDAGAVYVFSRTGSTWVQESYIKASNPDAYDYFGFAVSIFGDMLAVSAIGEDASGNGLGASQDSNGESSAGAVYLFARAQGAWSQVGYLKALNSEAGDEFGRGLALSQNTLVCGAQFEDSQFSGVNANPYNEGGGDSGAVYVFH